MDETSYDELRQASQSAADPWTDEHTRRASIRRALNEEAEDTSGFVSSATDIVVVSVPDGAFLMAMETDVVQRVRCCE